MPTKETETAPAEESIEASEEQAVSGVSADMKEAAKKDLKRVNKARESGVRVFKPGGVASQLYVSKLFPFPKDFSLENISPTSYLAQPEGEITGSVSTQTFSLVKERLEGLLFDQPARPLAAGRALKTVKWLKPDGTLSQLGYEGQVNNGAAGEPQDAIGLRPFVRKGGILFFDFDTLLPVYCFARNCWAAAMIDELGNVYPEHLSVSGSGYCSAAHFRFTDPSMARKWFAEGGSSFETDVTTSRSYRRN